MCMFLLFLFIFIFGSGWCWFSTYYNKVFAQTLDKITDIYDYDARKAKRVEFYDSKLYKRGKIFCDTKSMAEFITGIASIALLICLIALGVTFSPNIDDKIALYEEENQKIEVQIAGIVTEYQQFEYQIIKECAPDSAITLVSLYPDLKSDTLVAKQIEIYLDNNEKIKQLKETKINQKIGGWWFNFNLW